MTMLDRRILELRPSGQFPEQRLGPRHDVARVQEDLFGGPGLGQLLNAEAQRLLNTYRKDATQANVVRIPIAEAVDLYLTEHPQ
jgi:hypothetical protein